MNNVAQIIADPGKMLLVVASMVLAILCLLAWKRFDKPVLLYGHLVFALTPIFYAALLLNCSFGSVTSLLSFCTALFAKFVIYVLPPIMAASFVTGVVILPQLIRRTAKRYNASWFNSLCKKTNIAAELFIIDTQLPKAYAQGNGVFISVGAFEMLTSKEREAVVLHELTHVKQNAAWTKFSELFARTFSPIARFSKIGSCIEEQADAFAVQLQGTSCYLKSAKKKFAKF